MLKRNRVWLIVALLLLISAAVFPVAAQDQTVTDDEVNEVAGEIYCPVCENTPLDVCQTQACADWRELIRTKLASGETDQQIYDYFARQYGEGVLANPPSRGVSLVVLWVLPVVLLLIGALFFARFMRGLRGDEAQTATAGPAPAMPPSAAPKATGDDYLARVEEELGKTNE
ncbi:MAG: cytochrome c-type biogenesis protein CcmH [Candidatus Promineifilaceae bacterium]